MNWTKIILYVIIGILILLLGYYFFIRKKFDYVYKKNILTSDDFKSIVDECNTFDNELELNREEHINVMRHNLKLPKSSHIYNIISKYVPYLRKLIGNNKVFLAEFPIEYRKYIPGSFMKWHRDVQLYQKPQYECILTLSNSSDSFTEIEDEGKDKKKNLKIHSDPNSLIIVRAQGVNHQVTKMTKGERKFLKFILTETEEMIPPEI